MPSLLIVKEMLEQGGALVSLTRMDILTRT